MAELRVCNLVSATLVLLFQISHRQLHSTHSEVDEQLGCEGVTVSCWDWNFLGRNTFMVLPTSTSSSRPSLLLLTCHFLFLLSPQGRITIPISSIPPNRSVTRWFPLYPTRGHSTISVHGEIKLQLNLEVHLSSISLSSVIFSALFGGKQV